MDNNKITSQQKSAEIVSFKKSREIHSYAWVISYQILTAKKYPCCFY